MKTLIIIGITITILQTLNGMFWYAKQNENPLKVFKEKGYYVFLSLVLLTMLTSFAISEMF